MPPVWVRFMVHWMHRLALLSFVLRRRFYDHVQ